MWQCRPTTNLTYLGWPPTLNSGRPVLQLFGVLIPEKTASGAMLVFRSDNSSWRYLSCHQTHVLADGAPVRLGDAEHFGDVRSGYVSEQVRVEVSLNSLRDMASAARLEARVCSDEVELNSIEITAIQDLVKALDSHNASLPAR